jgi:hypothetical protein
MKSNMDAVKSNHMSVNQYTVDAHLPIPEPSAYDGGIALVEDG